MASRSSFVTALASAAGLTVAMQYVATLPVLAETWMVTLLMAGCVGAASWASARRLTGSEVGAVVIGVLGPWPASLLSAGLLVIPLDLVVPVGLAGGAAVAAAVLSGHRVIALSSALLIGVVGLGSSVAGAGAWTVGEPSATDPRMVAGNGVVVALDTHAFFLQQGAVILRGDGRTAVADFLASPDPTAPLRPGTSNHEPYLWRLQLGSRDADRVLKKPEMPDHFFNWWTHSGKGLVTGTSAATWAQQQFDKATQAWAAGDRAEAMYRLGAAAHLVQDACTPPHEVFLVPNHRAYEDMMMLAQSSLAVDGNGVYQSDFRTRRAHGGPEWSSAHTRGWVDECAHRAARLVVNTAQPLPSDPTSVSGRVRGTFGHFQDIQRITAGYLAFFFDTVGSPR
ncbi:MAG: hypothetical protein ABIN79_07370 [Marmoricola sp.]